MFLPSYFYLRWLNPEKVVKVRHRLDQLEAQPNLTLLKVLYQTKTAAVKAVQCFTNHPGKQDLQMLSNISALKILTDSKVKIHCKDFSYGFLQQ